MFHQITTLFDFHPFNGARNYSRNEKLAEAGSNGVLVSLAPMGFGFQVGPLMTCVVYLDGGSQYYLFRGANGRFPVRCTDPGPRGSPASKTVAAMDKPRLFLGVSHFSDKNGVVIPYDSACERFLLAAIKDEVERINKLPMEWRHVPDQTPDCAPAPVAPAAGKAQRRT